LRFYKATVSPATLWPRSGKSGTMSGSQGLWSYRKHRGTSLLGEVSVREEEAFRSE
jgi:hypothetical protein